MKGEIINVRVKPGHHTLLAELSVIDQLKLILANWQNRDAQELDANKTFALSDMKDKAGFITGENICIDGGMTKQMIYHNDFGWSLD